MTRSLNPSLMILAVGLFFSGVSEAASIKVINLRDGRKLSYREFGRPAGPMVFYFHGLPGSHMEPSLIADEIWQAGLHVIAVDRPGIGESTYQENRTILDWACDIEYLADLLGYKNKKFGIIAVSGGAPYGCACALKAGHRISHLALVTPFAPVEADVEKSSQNFLLQFAARNQDLAKLILSIQNKQLERNPDRAAKNGVRSFLPEERSLILDHPKVKQNYITNLEVIANQGPQGVVTEIKLLAFPWGFDVSKIRGVSVSIWAGGRDEIAPDSMAKYFSCQIPCSNLVINPETGHLSTFKQQSRSILSGFKSK